MNSRSSSLSAVLKLILWFERWDVYSVVPFVRLFPLSVSKRAQPPALSV